MVAAIERRDRADDGDDEHRDGRAGEERVHARDHVDAGGDHGGGVDQRADGRGAFHRVGQPDVERQLRRFADGAGEEQRCRSWSATAWPAIDGHVRGRS